MELDGNELEFLVQQVYVARPLTVQSTGRGSADMRACVLLMPWNPPRAQLASTSNLVLVP